MQFIECMPDLVVSDSSEPGLEVIKLFSCSIQLITYFILLINVKRSTIVVISMINTHKRLKPRSFFIYRYLNIYEQLKFRAQLS